MEGKLLQKMIEEAHLRRDIAAGAAIEIENGMNGRLRRLAIDFGIPDRRGVLAHDVHCGTVNAGEPTKPRRQTPMKRIFSLASLIVITTSAYAIDFADDFNRPDSVDLSGSWDILAGDIGVSGGAAAGRPFSAGLALAQSTGDVRNMMFQMIVRVESSQAYSYAAFAIGTTGTGAGEGLFVKIQDNNGDGMLDTYGFYTGNNQPTGFSGATFGVLDAPTHQARLTAFIDGDHVKMTVDSNLNGGSSAMLVAGGVNELVLGDRFGFGVSGAAFIDNYSATAVPEPASLATIGVGLAALRRRRK
jgi:hypothetical protein